MKKRIFLAIVVALLTFTSIPVMASNSPTGSSSHSVTVDGHTVGKKGSSGVKVNGGKVSLSTGTVKDGKEVTLTATPDKGKKFSKWIIDGDYIIVSGSLEEGTITIIPKGDIDIDAEFVDKNGNPVTTAASSSKGSSDNSVTSPKTGVATGVILMTLLVSGGAAIVSRKKFSE